MIEVTLGVISFLFILLVLGFLAVIMTLLFLIFGVKHKFVLDIDDRERLSEASKKITETIKEWLTIWRYL